ncbi:MAG: restriction endonuclease subunit S [Bacteroidota bacterium]
MRNDWRSVIIDDIIEGLYDGPHATPKPASSGPVFFGVKNLTEDGRIDLSDIRHISEDDFSKWTKRVLPKNDDIVFTYEASLHRYGLLKNNIRCCLGRRMALLRLNKSEVVPDFLLYYFLSPEWRQTVEQNIIVGATVNRIPISDFPNFKLSVPKIQEQRSIANVLSTLDAKIDLNNRINAELESLARTIYDYWFLQFDFPDENGKPYRSSGGKMRYDEALGREVPEGWAVKRLDFLICNHKGGDWGKSEVTENYTVEVSCIRGTDLDGLGRRGNLNPPTRYILEKNSHKILSDKQVVVETSGGSPTQSTGRIGYITENVLKRFSRPIICSNFCKNLSFTDPLFFWLFIKYWEKLYAQGVFFNFEGKTSGIKNLLFDSALSSLKIVVPPHDQLVKFDQFMTDIDSKIQNNLQQNHHLAALRDWLLPLLMSGQVRVGEASETDTEKV